MGHEIASHVLPHKVGPGLFKDDIDRAKKTLEDIIGKQVRRFRVTGFGSKENIKWPFNVIREVGYKYDSSVFPAMQEQNHMFGTTYGKTCRLDIIPTEAGPITEIPISAAKIFGPRFFGGGYLRLSPIRLMQWGIKKLHKIGCPLIVYIHPREIEPDHPRLQLGVTRYFRSYFNLKAQ